MNPTAESDRGLAVSLLPLSGQQRFGLHTLRADSALSFELLPSGAVYALRHEGTLINQMLPGPAEDGLFRMFLRDHGEEQTRPGSEIERSTSLVGAGGAFECDRTTAIWTRTVGDEGMRLDARTTLQLTAEVSGWHWRIQVTNSGMKPRHLDVVLAQDLGLGDEAAVRSNEAYASQYIDFTPLHDESWGWMVLARQNLAMAGGRHPWLGVASPTGAAGFCTDGWQFFGSDHRLTGSPAAIRSAGLPSKRLQYEFALAGLQSRLVTVHPGETGTFEFIFRYLPDHPAASSATDAELVKSVRVPAPSVAATVGNLPHARSVFTQAPWLTGDEPSPHELAEWFPGPHRQVERSADGRILSFFCADATHVATRAKEASIARPHGHVLRSGDYGWIDDEQFGFTAYAAGVFAAQSYLGNPSLARLVSVVRNALNVARASGQRIFIRDGDRWMQLGVPSAFALTPGDVRWFYRLGDSLITARAWCSATLSCAMLDISVTTGAPREFLVTHQIAAGGNEFESGTTADVFEREQFVRCSPAPGSFTGAKLPNTCFAIATAMNHQAAEIGGDEFLYDDHQRRGGPYVVLKTRPVRSFGVLQVGSTRGPNALPELVAAARAEFSTTVAPACPPPVRLKMGGSPSALGRIAEIVPWLNHNAAIHFSAPHGLEQYGGAAWGVRDVCQGSLEWLLASGRADIAGRMVRTVFAQQYLASSSSQAPLTGSWPQWFMFPPFQAIQQAHSHGDVCFWPVKALCDYVEWTNDLGILSAEIGYADPSTFATTAVKETLWAHCDRVVSHVESRLLTGTALVNYGDGDWDDTLQPADPTLRTHMVSAWTVGLAYHTFRQLADVCRRSGEMNRAERLAGLLARMRRDFETQLILDGVVAGFLIRGADGTDRPLLHPSDSVTEIRYRLLPMTRAILAELFTPEEARRHLTVISKELWYPDGVRLMSAPATYHGGPERLFRRAESAANVGREIGLQYVHAHLRYAEALAKVGDAEGLWTALQVVNPVGLAELLPNATLRQSNVYFSSSDADFDDRYEAGRRWPELRTGAVPVRAGWRLYSSGPGLYLHKLRTSLLGIRESFGDVVFDPVLPKSLDGLIAEVELAGRQVEVVHHVRNSAYGPVRIIVNGHVATATRESNPYRRGGLRVSGSELADRLVSSNNRIEVEL